MQTTKQPNEIPKGHRQLCEMFSIKPARLITRKDLEKWYPKMTKVQDQILANLNRK